MSFLSGTNAAGQARGVFALLKPIAAPCALLSLVILAGCSAPVSKAVFPESVYGPASPRVATEGDDIPRGGGSYKVGRPYQVAGRWFHPEVNKSYDEVGVASWYGPKFHGRQTANGEIFDRHAITAAHPTLPMPSYVRVTNVNNNRSIIVRVNDRGPFARNRIIDLSERTADVLGVRNQGVARVRVEYVGRAPLNGDDQPMLMASLSDNGPAQMPGGVMGGTMLADASSTAQPRTPSNVAHSQPSSMTFASNPHGQSQQGFQPSVQLGSVPMPQPVYRNYASAPAPQQQIQQTGFNTPPASFQPQQSQPIVLASNSSSLPMTAAPAGSDVAVVQLGVFGESQNAQNLANNMGHLGEVMIEPVATDNRPLYRVRIMVERRNLDATMAHAAQAGITQPRIIAH